MCRFLVYRGPPLVMADLLTRTAHSIIHQSFEAREQLSNRPVNGDGFGVGWYSDDTEEDPLPCIFTSVTPAWNNRSLQRLAEKVVSPLIYAHVRGATPGSIVSESNNHPFQYKNLLFMHNGDVSQFGKIKRRLRESLSDRFYNWIEGSTDSEHVFALFLEILNIDSGPENTADVHRFTPSALRAAMEKTIAEIVRLSEEAGIDTHSLLNLVVSDGEVIVASRYVNSPTAAPASLYYASGASLDLTGGGFHLAKGDRREHVVVIASEPVTNDDLDWVRVPPNMMLTVTKENIFLNPIALPKS